MYLRDYLRENQLTQVRFAEKFSPPVTQSVVSDWIRGKSRITLAHALQIQKITGGQVTPEDCAALYLG